MQPTPPPFPAGQPPCFRSTVHGTVFGDRERVVATIHSGDPVRLVADPPVQNEPEVWVHTETGEPIGHLPSEIARWLWPWLSGGGIARARAVQVRGDDVPSWRRVLLEVSCQTA